MNTIPQEQQQEQAPDLAQAREHIKLYLSRCPEGQYIELRSFFENRKGKGATRFIKSADELDAALLWAAERHSEGRALYIGQCPRLSERGTKENVRALTTLYVDADYYKSDKSLEELKAFAAAYTVPPSLIVNSGNGAQLDWFVQETEDTALWEQTQRKLYNDFRAFGSDTAVVSDWARVLRLSGFLHRKDAANPKPVYIESRQDREPLSLYALAEQIGVGDDHAITPSPRGWRDGVMDDPAFSMSGKEGVYPEILPDGGDETTGGLGRNQWAIKYACDKARQLEDYSEVLTLALQFDHDRNKPPLGFENIKGKVDSAFRYLAEDRKAEQERMAEAVTAQNEAAESAELEFGMTGDQMLNSAVVLPDYLIYGTARGQVSAFVSDNGVGKTTVQRNCALSACVGRDYLDLVKGGKPLKVAYLDFEDDRELAKKDIQTMCADFDPYEVDRVKENLLYICDLWIHDQPFKLTTPAHWAMLLKRLDKFKPDIIFVDTMSEAFEYRDENSIGEMNETVITPLKALANRYSAAVLLAHHTSKTENGVAKQNRMRGASSLGGAMRSQYYLSLVGDGDVKQVRLEHSKHKGRKMRTFYLPYDTTGEIRWLHEATQIARIEPSQDQKFANKLYAAIRTAGGNSLSRKDAIEACEVSPDTFKKYAAPLVERGFVIQSGGGRGKEAFYTLPENLVSADIIPIDGHKVA